MVGGVLKRLTFLLVLSLYAAQDTQPIVKITNKLILITL